MALYKYQQHLQYSDHAAFDQISHPGVAAPYPAIYRCEGCGHEIAIAHNHILPAQNHPQHSLQQGTIRWRLIVSHG
jgi:hypothetical protein